MPTVYPSSPYFDDYDQTKQFYRILFRPGRAVQARELTQIQTLIQSQIERFGRGVYKEGSFVTPPKETYDTNYTFVKLEDSYLSVDADDVLEGLVDQVIVGQTTGVRARVVNYTVSTTAGDPPTLYVKYLNSGSNGTTTAFADSEVITNVASTTSVRAISSSATGAGTAYSLGTSTIFAKGNFLYVEEQTHIVEKYGAVVDRIIGFDITETTVNSDSDPSLLDPALGTFNYFAPGADRYKITLALNDRAFTPTTTDDPNFIELGRIQDGVFISKFIEPRLSVLGDTLARRTFDESGDYVVKPYNVSLIEHLRTSNINQTFGAIRDGLFLASEGGNSSLFVGIVSPGKAYVRGYEVENYSTTRVTFEKAREFANVNSGTVATQLSSFVKVDNVYSIPAFDEIASIDLYNKYTSTLGSSNGTKIGTAKARGFQYLSGDVEARTAVYQLHIFDVNMEPGYSFERNAKQVFSDNTGIVDFTANINPTLTELSGTVSISNSSNVITGSGTRFTTEVQVGDYISISNTTTYQRFEVYSVTDDTTLQSVNNAVGTKSGFIASLNTSTINDADKDTFVIEFPYDVIKTVDPTNTETTYTVKRQYTRTLSAANAVTITSGTNETFAPYSADNYSAVVTSGFRTGNLVSLNSTIVTRGGSPTGATITFDFTTATDAANLTNQTVELYTTVNKTNSASVKKTKTLVANATVDFITQAAAQSSILSLGKADGFKLRSVRMSNVTFGSSYVEAGSSNITARYTFDNGQKETFYDLAKLYLKPNQPKPTNPIRVTFDYFTHGSGDYFTVDSYSGIDYKDIPTTRISGNVVYLRDCLDFRPRINDAGTGFTGTGASLTEFIDPEIDFQTDYQYYLSRIDKLVVDKDGLFFVVKGTSSLNPKEPNTPDGSLALYTIKQNPYVVSLSQDIELIKFNNRRYTMRDIGSIENRVKNLEYYTTLSFLERDAQQYQIKDNLGFERFKNGFLVDSFTGHGVGDANNPDYAVSVDYGNREARPLTRTRQLKLSDQALTAAEKLAKNYVVSSDLATLPYTETVFLENRSASSTENLNPFNIGIYQGLIKLDPPGDLWFDDKRVPAISVDAKGRFTTLTEDAQNKKDGENFFGTIRDIEQLRTDGVTKRSTLPDAQDVQALLTQIDPSATTIETTDGDVVRSATVVPKMRNVDIRFTVDGLKPNTKMYAFFEDEQVTQYCKQIPAQFYTEEAAGNTQAAANLISNVSINSGLVTDTIGRLDGIFYYDSTVLNVDTGLKTFRLSNSSTNNRANEDSYAEQIFFTEGIVRDIANQSIRINNQVYSDSSDFNYSDAPVVNTVSFLTSVYQQAFGRDVDPSGDNHYQSRAAELGVNISGDVASVRAQPNGNRLINEIVNGGVEGVEIDGSAREPSTQWVETRNDAGVVTSVTYDNGARSIPSGIPAHLYDDFISFTISNSVK